MSLNICRTLIWNVPKYLSYNLRSWIEDWLLALLDRCERYKSAFGLHFAENRVPPACVTSSFRYGQAEKEPNRAARRRRIRFMTKGHDERLVWTWLSPSPSEYFHWCYTTADRAADRWKEKWECTAVLIRTTPIMASSGRFKPLIL